MTSPFGLPSNYTSNAMYQQYAQMIFQAAQKQQEWIAQQKLREIQQEQAQQTALLQADRRAADLRSMEAENQTQPIQNGVQPPNIPPKGDGKDDGSISFGKKVGNFFKGVGNFFKGMVCDENGKFSLKRTLTTAAVAAGAVALTVAMGGAATPFLVAAGATMGAVQTGKGIYKAVTAKTDADAESAWQEIGSGATALAGSVAGAKGALKVAGKLPAPAPSISTTSVVLHSGTPGSTVVSSTAAAAKTGRLANAWNSVKNAFGSTKDCLKIAGKGSWEGMKGLAHPMKSARNISAYYKNTMKPNLVQAFSPKNAMKNFRQNVKDNEMSELSKINDKVRTLQEQLSKPGLSPKNVKDITSKIQSLREEALLRAAKVVDADNIHGFNSRDLSKLAELNKHNRETLLKNIENAVTKEDRIVAENTLKSFDKLVKFTEKNQRIEYMSDSINRAQNTLREVNDKLKAGGLTDIQKAAMESKVSKLESIISKNQKALFKVNARVAAQRTLPQVGLGYGSYYLSNPSAQVDGLNLSEADAYAQANGFQSFDQMQQYLQSMQDSQNVLNSTDQFLATNNNANQYAANMFQNSNMQIPQESPLSFNDLYVSPYPDMVF